MTLAPSEIILRIALALVAGAIIGVEREWRHKAAGIKTTTLVALGSAAFALMSDTFGPNNHSPAQLAAAVISGIGFIGAGVIIHRGASVQGVTTAATLWAAASLGVAIGLGYFVVGAAVFVAVLVVQFGMRRAVSAVEARRGPALQQVEVRIECDEASLPEVNAAWSQFAHGKDIATLRHATSRAASGLTWTALFIARGIDLAALEDRLMHAAGVTRVEARRTTQSED